MNEISNITTQELMPIIKDLYACLFDTDKKFNSLKGFQDVVDHGIVKFKGEKGVRKISLKYKGKFYELGIYNYIRENGNCLAIRNGETDRNFIQYVLDKFIILSGNKILLSHDGVTTGSTGKTKDACIVEIAKNAPHLIKIDGKNKSINLGYLENVFQFEDESFQKLITNFIEYAILRNNFKNNLDTKINLTEDFYTYLCTIRNKNKEHESIYNFEADKGKFNRIIDRISNYFDYEILEVNSDYSDVSYLSEKVKNDFEILKNKNDEYIAFNDKTESGIPNSIINTHYQKFLNQLTNNSTDMTFAQLVESLKKYFISENIHYDIVHYKPRTNYVWIADGKGIIGDSIAHYEVSKKGSKIFIDIHFEGKKKEKDIFHNSITTLPDSLEWLDWQSSKSIRYSEIFNINDDDILEKITSALEYIDENIGDEIRGIINNLPPIKILDNGKKGDSTEIKHALNQILYGPPGTGKTYNTINKALEIINDDETNKLDFDDRKAVKTLFDKRMDEGQIMFTTFHQNMSYEDFIEGIKPITIDNDVIYKIEEGIFKKLCEKAAEKKTSRNFDDSYANFIDEVLAKGSLTLETPTHKKKFKVIINSNETAVAIPETEKGTNMGVTKEMSRDYIINGTIRDWKPYTTSIGEYIKENYPVDIENVDNSNKKFVIIIDEINRGNVSKIFGELITLIEESKRTGKSEAITVTLPYSKNLFSVPANVYILGTMNTADRSVEALDTALRRRFDFVEMMPKYDLIIEGNKEKYQINGYFAFDILEVINKRIEVLLGRDHLIGHSFFLLDESETIELKLKSAFYKNIIPLLQEYFYGDYNKIGLVLGSGFVKKIKVENHNVLFADDKHFNGNDYVGRETYNYSIAEFNDDRGFYNALDILMDRTSSSETDE